MTDLNFKVPNPDFIPVVQRAEQRDDRDIDKSRRELENQQQNIIMYQGMITQAQQNILDLEKTIQDLTNDQQTLSDLIVYLQSQ